MKIETVAALLCRMLGVAVLLFGALGVLDMAISYFFLRNALHVQDTYFVNASFIWGGLLFMGGVLLLFFSKALGRLLARGLE